MPSVMETFARLGLLQPVAERLREISENYIVQNILNQYQEQVKNILSGAEKNVKEQTPENIMSARMMALTSPEFMKATLGAISQLSQTRRGQEIAEGLLRGYATIVSPYNIFGSMIESIERGKYYNIKGNVEQQQVKVNAVENLVQLVSKYGGNTVSTAMGKVLKDLGVVDDKTLEKLGEIEGIDQKMLQLEFDKQKLNEYEVKKRIEMEEQKLKLLQQKMAEEIDLLKTQKKSLDEEMKYFAPDKIAKLIEMKTNIMNLMLLADAYREKELITDEDARKFKEEVMKMSQLLNDYENAVLNYAMNKLKTTNENSEKKETKQKQKTKTK
jgi:hypothetical protein